MTTRMLIDARHREETRVAVVKGNRIEELDFESAEHKQLKGNIYLAKVTRVEPSLQAAFVDYGGNRHGFLAFAEIHPDYYQIPKEDRDKLLADEAEAAAEEVALREQEEAEENEPAEIIKSDAASEEDADLIEVDSDDSIDTIDIAEGEEPDLDSDDDADDDEDGDDASENEADAEPDTQNERKGRGRNNRRRRGGGGGGRGRGRGGKAKASDEARAKRMNLRRRYKIQDVIHRRQVLLVQVVKEERGNKGAALTSYMSLAGRYCVLMPNTSHGGGISRKISNASDRKKLKSIVADLKLPSTMGCIIRTAGLARTKTEIKRDFDYLARLWDEIRDRTLGGAAPMLIHTDSDLIKRAIRDIYNGDIDEVMVEGEDGYKAAKDFMKLLMPSHAKRVRQYADSVPLYQRYKVEDQLSAMYQPVVQLKSGGYIVINPTEALVSIDINSGRSTKEHGIEQTALATNLEAAREIARQLRLRDMAGLVVIDFIDMERHGNSRKVERAMKEALKNDRARIQVGRISSFGLMEMSRQRLRTGVLEASTRECPHCEGTGLVRTASSAALSALRIIEEEAARGKGSQIQLQASHEATIYVLNNKRAELAEIEERYGVAISILPNGESEGVKQSVSSSGPRPAKRAMLPPLVQDNDDDDIDVADGHDKDEHDKDEAYGEDRGKRKRRRGRRGGRGRNRDRDRDSVASTSDANADRAPKAAAEESDAGGDEKPKRGRRGGRTAKSESDSAEAVISEETSEKAAKEEKPKRRRKTKAEKDAEAETKEAAKADDADKPKRKRATAAKPKKADDESAEDKKPKSRVKKPKADSDTKAAEPKKRAPRRKKADADGDATGKVPAEKAAAKKPAPKSAQAQSKDADDDGKQTKTGDARSGWWQRTFG
ncbi:MAG: Rne/Rng family ribonuclease [Sphingorhabdus sp.]